MSELGHLNIVGMFIEFIFFHLIKCNSRSSSLRIVTIQRSGQKAKKRGQFQQLVNPLNLGELNYEAILSTEASS